MGWPLVFKGVALASTYGIIGRVGVLVEPTFKGVQEKVRDGLGKPIAKQAPKRGVDVGNAIVNGTTKALKWGGVAAGAALGTAITKGFGRLRAMEDATAKIKGLGYEAQEVDQIMTDVQGALDGTMFLYSEGADVAAGALAAGVEQGEELEAYLRLTADAATQANVEYGAMGQMMNKVASSGRLTGDVLNQLEENGVYVGAAIADSLGVTQEEFRKMVSQGEVSADVFMQVMEEQFGGSSEQAADTMTGAMSLAWTAVGQLGEKLINEVYPYLKEFFQGFYKWVQDISPKVEEFGRVAGDMLGNVIGWMVDNPGAVKAFAAAIGAVAAAFVGYTAAVKLSAAWTKIMDTATDLLNGTIKLNPIGLWVAAIAALVTGLIWAYNNVDWFRNAVQVAWDAITTAFTWAWENVIQPVINWIGEAWNWLADVFVQVWQDYLSPVFEVIGTVVTWLWENIISPLFGYIMGLFLSLGEFFQAVWENVLKPVFEGIAAVATWLWENVLSPVFTWIGDHWHYVVEAMAWVWEYILKPVWDAIAAVAVWLWENVLSPVFSWIGEHWSTVMDIMKWAWDYILKPVWDAIVIVATWLWETILSPIFTYIGQRWGQLMTAMKWAWENILKPAWDMLVTVATWLWEKILLPVFTYIGERWEQLMTAMKWVWENILKPAWDAIVTVATWLWENVLEPIFSWIGEKWDDIMRGMKLVWEEVLKPAFKKIGETVLDLKDKFHTAVDNIKKVWDTLKGVAAKPIKFVIEKVINDGLISGFNALIGLIPFMDLKVDPVPVPKWMQGYARGGWTGPGSKYEPAGVVHADEYVLNKEATNKLRAQVGLAGLDYMNKTGRFPGYASGGLVRPVNGRFTSGFGASRGRYPHAGVDWAVPVGTPVRAALAGSVARTGWNVVNGRTGIGVLLSHPGNRNTYYGHLSKSQVSVGDEVAKGAVIGLSGNTGRSTGPHLHFETWTGGKPVDPLKYMGGLPASDSGGEGWFDPLAPLRALADKVGGWFSEKFPLGGFMVDAAKQTATGAINKVIDWLGGIIGMNGDNEGGGTGDAKQQVKDVAARYGWDSGSQWTALDKLIQAESSWNVNAANPNSSARGLFQKMTSIHGPAGETASQQAEWGLNYIRNRYGSPMSAWMHHRQRGWYADGGLVEPLLRDNGGELPRGLSMILNNRPESEWIVNKPQIDRMAENFAARGQAGVTINGDVWAHSPEQVAREIHKDARRAAALAPVL